MKYIDNVVSLCFDESKCTGCGMCAEVCPHNVFKVDRIAEIINKNKCIECGACAKNCPFQAIKVCSGVGCGYAMIKSKITGKEESCCC